MVSNDCRFTDFAYVDSQHPDQSYHVCLIKDFKHVCYVLELCRSCRLYNSRHLCVLCQSDLCVLIKVAQSGSLDRFRLPSPDKERQHDS